MSGVRDELVRWQGRFRALAARTLPAGTAAPELADPAFADEFGHRRPVDRPFLSALLRRQPPGDNRPLSASVDVQLWALAAEIACAEPEALAITRAQCEKQVWSLLGDSVSSGDEGAGRSWFGPVFGEPFAGTVEVFTESQLCGLHALDAIGLALGSDAIMDRVAGSCRWLQDNLQPDNATNHPWAAQTFVRCELLGLITDGAMYAGTLLSNCQVTLGRPDRLSAAILVHSAELFGAAVARLPE